MDINDNKSDAVDTNTANSWSNNGSVAERNHANSILDVQIIINSV